MSVRGGGGGGGARGGGESTLARPVCATAGRVSILARLVWAVAAAAAAAAALVLRGGWDLRSGATSSWVGVGGDAGRPLGGGVEKGRQALPLPSVLLALPAFSWNRHSAKSLHRASWIFLLLSALLCNPRPAAASLLVLSFGGGGGGGGRYWGFAFGFGLGKQ